MLPTQMEFVRWQQCLIECKQSDEELAREQEARIARQDAEQREREEQELQLRQTQVLE